MLSIWQIAIMKVHWAMAQRTFAFDDFIARPIACRVLLNLGWREMWHEISHSTLEQSGKNQCLSL
jgi:hypothetical protein